MKHATVWLDVRLEAGQGDTRSLAQLCQPTLREFRRIRRIHKDWLRSGEPLPQVQGLVDGCAQNLPDVGVLNQHSERPEPIVRVVAHRPEVQASMWQPEGGHRSIGTTVDLGLPHIAVQIVSETHEHHAGRHFQHSGHDDRDHREADRPELPRAAPGHSRHPTAQGGTRGYC